MDEAPFAAVWNHGAVHVFVDESKRSGYLLASVAFASGRLDRARGLMRGLLLPGERRVHFRSEKDTRRKFVLARMVDFGVSARVYSASVDGEYARDALLRILVEDVIGYGGQRLVLEARDPVGNSRDRVVLGQTAARKHELAYEHREASTEPILWMSDAIAWSAGAGGDWRRRIEPMIEHATRLPKLESAKPRRRPSGRVPGLTSRGYCP
jgi:hypothetical protein